MAYISSLVEIEYLYGTPKNIFKDRNHQKVTFCSKYKIFFWTLCPNILDQHSFF